MPLEPEVRLGRATVETRAGLVELITLRGLIIGRIADYVRAEEIAEQLVRDAPTDARAFVARARTRATFHRFNDALADLDRAERLSLDAETANGERAAIFQAVGRYDEALALREEAVARRASFENVAALVGLHAERGEIEAAERRYAQSRSRYRGVSPFPLALLDFQLGLMWMNEGRLDRCTQLVRCRAVAVCPLMRRRKAISPRLKRNWVKSTPRLRACIRSRCPRTILITLRSLRAFLPRPAATANPGTGAGWPQRALVSSWLVARRPSPTMQPNSGLARVPIRTRRSGWRK